MEGRCEVLDEFGATFYEHVEKCDKLPQTLIDGLAEGKTYETLLQQMEDDKYSED